MVTWKLASLKLAPIGYWLWASCYILPPRFCSPLHSTPGPSTPKSWNSLTSTEQHGRHFSARFSTWQRRASLQALAQWKEKSVSFGTSSRCTFPRRTALRWCKSQRCGRTGKTCLAVWLLALAEKFWCVLLLWGCCLSVKHQRLWQLNPGAPVWRLLVTWLWTEVMLK